MIPPIPTLQDYGISPMHGFLPMELPLEVLPDAYYSRWEAIASNLQALILSRRLRGVIEGLPVLSTSGLQHPAEWRRAYSILSFMTHAYIWGGNKPEEVSLQNQVILRANARSREYLHPSPFPFLKFVPISNFLRSLRTPPSVFGILSQYLQTSQWTHWKIYLHY